MQGGRMPAVTIRRIDDAVKSPTPAPASKPGPPGGAQLTEAAA